MWDIAVNKTGGFVVSKVVLATISAFFHCTFFYIIQVPYWLPMGIFAGVVSQFIPTIGTYIGVAIPALFAAFDDPFDVVWIIIFATVYQQIESYVFTPRVSRATMDIHPAIALGSVFVGFAFFGPIGAIIGIPLAAAVIAIIETYGDRHELVPELQVRTKGEKPSKPGDALSGDPDHRRPRRQAAHRGRARRAGTAAPSRSTSRPTSRRRHRRHDPSPDVVTGAADLAATGRRLPRRRSRRLGDGGRRRTAARLRVERPVAVLRPPAPRSRPHRGRRRQRRRRTRRGCACSRRRARR